MSNFGHLVHIVHTVMNLFSDIIRNKNWKVCRCHIIIILLLQRDRYDIAASKIYSRLLVLFVTCKACLCMY